MATERDIKYTEPGQCSMFSNFRPESKEEEEWLSICKELEEQVFNEVRNDEVITPEVQEAFDKWVLKETVREEEARAYMHRHHPAFANNIDLDRRGISKEHRFEFDKMVMKYMNNEYVNYDYMLRNFEHFYDSLRNDGIPPKIYHFCMNAFILGYTLPSIWIMCRASLRQRKIPVAFRYKDLQRWVSITWKKKREEYKKLCEDMKLKLFADCYAERFRTEERFVRIQLKALDTYMTKLEELHPIRDQEEYDKISRKIKTVQKSVDSVHGIEKMRDAMIEVAAEQAKKTISDNFDKTGANTPQAMIGAVIDMQITSEGSNGPTLDLPPVTDVDLIASDSVAYSIIE
jgi:hypothetical protein